VIYRSSPSECSNPATAQAERGDRGRGRNAHRSGRNGTAPSSFSRNPVFGRQASRGGHGRQDTGVRSRSVSPPLIPHCHPPNGAGSLRRCLRPARPTRHKPSLWPERRVIADAEPMLGTPGPGSPSVLTASWAMVIKRAMPLGRGVPDCKPQHVRWFWQPGELDYQICGNATDSPAH